MCHCCHKKGHIAKVCRSKVKGSQSSVYPRHHHVIEDSTEDSLALFHLDRPVTQPITVDVCIDGVSVNMEVDTGAAMSVMTHSQKQKLFPTAVLEHSSIVLRTYTTEKLQIMGEMTVCVEYGDQKATLPLLIVEGEGPALLGCDWLSSIKLDWSRIAYTTPSGRLQQILDQHKDVFKDELGTVQGMTVSLSLKEGTHPKFFRPWPVPLAIKGAVGDEIDRLVAAGILEKVDHSEWATPIVPVPKKDGQF